MEVVIPFFLFMILAVLPLIAYYLGWLAGPAPEDGARRVMLFAYLGFIVVLGIMFAVLFGCTLWLGFSIWTAAIPFGVLLVTAPALTIWFFWSAVPPDPIGGICDRCGYNLRGNMSGRCPECGMLIEPAC